jgi:Rieske Fe-S protein
MTRGDFLGLGLMGTIMGAVLTIPPVAFILSPIIKTNVLGQSNVTDDWQEVGPVSEIPDEEPADFTVEFPITQAYGDKKIAQKSEGFTEQERQQLVDSINVLSNSCAHLGCPVRWLVNTDGVGEFLCPCHGGIYDINGGWVGGPPPRGMYHYTKVKVEEDGKLYVKHAFNIQDRLDAQHPYVV